MYRLKDHLPRKKPMYVYNNNNNVMLIAKNYL